ncbi:uncharacterized protein [Nerophis lumbriciformis]|uniref:uncharacterized protein isoform X1 n=1 Tax=Nerophis lumbriciformis TaxID=546530 RepID=UPI002ADF183C|nr:uncharacterized protein LOC133620683 isoform X1 [Nerophis lumbriciformis]
MKLPAIYIAATPVHCSSRPCSLQQSRSQIVRPITFPLISEFSSQLCTSNQVIPRLNPLCPLLVSKRTVSLETPVAHHHNQQRTLIMQKREHARYHQIWQRPFYGTSMEKEEYRYMVSMCLLTPGRGGLHDMLLICCRRELREQLKRQMEEKSVPLTLQLASKVKEAEYMREMDRLALSAERAQALQHRKAMSSYRDENKRLMEQRWRDRALTHSQEVMMERERLRLNPINWSGTLK